MYLRYAREIPELWASGKATPKPVQDPLPVWLGVNGLAAPAPPIALDSESCGCAAAA